MLIVAVRTLILYVLVLFAMRLMGKSELSKMSPFQLVIVFMIAELAAIPIDDPAVSLANGVMAIFTLMFLQILISCLSIKIEGVKNCVTGKPSILIEKGRLNVKDLRRLRITSTDLLEQLRLENCPSLADVQYAIMESNGQLTVIPKADAQPLKPRDMKLAVSNGSLPVILVSDGILYDKNLQFAGVSEEVFRKKLTLKGLRSYEEIFLAFSDENKKIHVYLHAGKRSCEDFAQEVKL